MAIRIGEDGSIISTEGEITQGHNPIIGEDGSIRLGDQQMAPGYSTTNVARIPPSSPLENGGAQQTTERETSNRTSQTEASGQSRSNSTATRPVSTIEYELQVKKAELNKCIRPAPIIVCVLFIVIAFAIGNFIPAIVSLIAAVPIFQDIMRRSEVSNEVNRLNEELNNARRGA